MKRRNVKAVLKYHTPNKIKEPESYFNHLIMFYYPWRDENNLVASDETYTSKFYEPDIQAIVKNNRAIFEPDAVSEALEVLKSNQGNTIHSYDSNNDQENADLKGEVQDDSIPHEAFNEQLLSHLDPITQCDHHTSAGTISSHNLPTEISDDLL